MTFNKGVMYVPRLVVLKPAHPATLLPAQVATSVELEDSIHDRYIRANLDNLTIQIEHRTYGLQQRRCSLCVHARVCVVRAINRWSWFLLSTRWLRGVEAA